jgi:cell wall-associated NlpC family hydrolase
MIGLAATLAAPPIAGSAPVEDLQAQAKAVQGQIDANGAKIAALSEQLNAAQIKVDDAEGKIADADARAKAAEDQTNRLRLILSQRAADLYKAAGGSGPFDSIDTGDTNELASQRKYSEIASGKDDAIIGQLAEAKQDLARERAAAEEARQDAATQRDSLKGAKSELDSANAKQQSILNGLNGEIATILENQRKEQKAREDAALAASIANPQPTQSSTPGAAPRTSGNSGSKGPAYDGPPVSVSGGAGAAVAYAQAQVGKPYCYAGTGPDCYDCSGLTMMAWRQGGISMPHFSGSQAAMFPRVPISQMQPGDLITTSSWPAHVGMWVGGGFIHATHTGDFIRYVPGSDRVVDAVRPG